MSRSFDRSSHASRSDTRTEARTTSSARRATSSPYGPRGGDTGKQRTVTRGEPLPPTPKAGQHFKLDDPTKH